MFFALTSLICCIFLTTIFNLSSEENVNLSSQTLKLVHVIHRHGDRNPDPNEIYPNSPYLNDPFEPFGLGEITALGRQQLFAQGQFLRQRYDQFLGSHYYPEIYQAWCTDILRTQTSLLYELTALFSYDKLEWYDNMIADEFPHTVLNVTAHPLMGLPLNYSEEYRYLYNKALNTEATQSSLNSHQQLFDYINKHSGLNATTYYEMYRLYYQLYMEEEIKHCIPQWTKPIFPFSLQYMTVYEYQIQHYYREMLQYVGGTLVEKIIIDSLQKMNNTDSATKLFIYSGHEFNIVHTLSALNIYFPHTPPYGAMIIIELHEIDGIHGFKIFYNDYSLPDIRPMVMPQCNLFCPLEKFLELTLDVLPAHLYDTSGSKQFLPFL